MAVGMRTAIAEIAIRLQLLVNRLTNAMVYLILGLHPGFEPGTTRTMETTFCNSVAGGGYTERRVLVPCGYERIVRSYWRGKVDRGPRCDGVRSAGQRCRPPISRRCHPHNGSRRSLRRYGGPGGCAS